MGIDNEFAAIIRWLKPRGLTAHTRQGNPLILYRRQDKIPLEVRDGKLKRKETAK